jgi:hypothetical protein
MRIPTKAKYAVSAVAALALLAGPTIASAGVSAHPFVSQARGVRPSLLKTLPPSILISSVARQHQHVSGQVAAYHNERARAGATTYIYTCNYYGSDCQVYNGTTYALITKLTSGLSNPQGTSVNWIPPKRTWSIANTGLSNVLQYSPGGTTLLNTITDSGEYPVDVTAGFKTNTTIISNIYTTSFTAGSVNVCVASSCTKLTDPNAFEGIGIALDGSGNCYWSFNDNSGIGQVDEFTGCAGTPTNLGITEGFAGGMAFDAAGNLWYSDQLAGVYKCSGTSNCVLTATGFTDGLMINFKHKFTGLLVADAGAGNVDNVDPSTGTVTTLFSEGTSDPPFGVAGSPATHY